MTEELCGVVTHQGAEPCANAVEVVFYSTGDEPTRMCKGHAQKAETIAAALGKQSRFIEIKPSPDLYRVHLPRNPS